MNPITLREATPQDAAAIAAIYAPYVQGSIVTFEEVPPDATEIAARLAKTRDAGLPWLVATDTNGIVTGYAYAGPFAARSAYRYALENSVYVAAERQRQGVGAALLQKLIDDCAALGYRQMVALIAQSEASIALHRRAGFADAGKLTAVGFKLGRWIDVTYMQRAL